MKENKLINYINTNYKEILNIKVEDNMEKPNIILENFLNYFKNQWIDYFEQDIVNLKGVNIKFRSNNCLENFNKQLIGLVIGKIS